MKGRRSGLPAEPLVRWLHRHGMDFGPTALGRLAGLSKHTGAKWVRGIPIPTWTADKIAGTLGVHPSAVWGELWWSHTPTVDTTHNYLAFPHHRDAGTDQPWPEDLAAVPMGDADADVA